MRFWILGVVGFGVFGALVVAACGDTTFSGTSTTDGSVADSASSDANFVDAPSLGNDASDPCQDGQPHSLCDDFDMPTLAANWSKNVGCANPTLDTSTFVSSPQSLRASNDAGQYACAYYEGLITPASFPIVHCEADVKLTVPAPQFFDFFKIWTSFDTINYYQASIAYAGQAGGQDFPVILGDDAIPDGGSPVFNSVNMKVARTSLGNWVHVSLEINFETHTINAEAAGISATMPTTMAPSGGVSQNQMFLRVGFEYQGEGGPGSVSYDNVFCDTR